MVFFYGTRLETVLLVSLRSLLKLFSVCCASAASLVVMERSGNTLHWPCATPVIDADRCNYILTSAVLSEKHRFGQKEKWRDFAILVMITWDFERILRYFEKYANLRSCRELDEKYKAQQVNPKADSKQRDQASSLYLRQVAATQKVVGHQM